VQDCCTFHLSTKEALEYIETRFKKISERSYKRRKSFIESDHSTQVWLNYYTRIGFILQHKEQIEIIQYIQKDSIQRLEIEKQKDPRDESRILALKKDIKENTMLLSELSLGTPIVSAIRAKLQLGLSRNNKNKLDVNDNDNETEEEFNDNNYLID